MTSGGALRGAASFLGAVERLEGARNAEIASLAGMLFRRRPDPEVAAVLVACFNQAKCKPPLEADELKAILDSIADREMRRRKLA